MNKDRENMAKAIVALDEMRDMLLEICAIIYMEMPLRYQDEWVLDKIKRGIYEPDKEIKGDME